MNQRKFRFLLESVGSWRWRGFNISYLAPKDLPEFYTKDAATVWQRAKRLLVLYAGEDDDQILKRALQGLRVPEEDLQLLRAALRLYRYGPAGEPSKRKGGGGGPYDSFGYGHILPTSHAHG